MKTTFTPIALMISIMIAMASCTSTKPSKTPEQIPPIEVVTPPEVVELPPTAEVIHTPLPAEVTPTPAPAHPVIVVPTPTEVKESKQIKVTIKRLLNFNSAQEKRFRRIAANVEVVINTVEFKGEVTLHKYNGKSMFVSTKDTPAQVYAKIMAKDWALDYRLEALSRITSRNVIGYTLPSVTWIAFNSYKWSYLDDADIAANICHEYGGHKFGRYDHDQNWSASRDHSAPYWLGTACERVYRKLYKL